MTRTTNHDVVRLSTRDWIGLIFLLVSAMSGGFKLIYDLRVDIQTNRAELQELRTELSVAAPAPAKWTIEHVSDLQRGHDKLSGRVEDHERRIGVLETRIMP